MGLHEYNVPNGSRRNPGTAQLLLSEEDAKRLGLTEKDRVSSKDQTVQGAGSTFEPSTEAELAGAPVTAPAKPRATRTRAATSGRRPAAKQAKAPKNKSAAPAADKDAAAPAAAAPAGNGSDE